MDDPNPQSERPSGDSGSARSSYPEARDGNSGERSILGTSTGAAWGELRRIGIFGGSFDPVHFGHLYVAAKAQAARGLERVVFLPAAQPPHKPGQVLASGADRVAMLELALRAHPDWIVDSLELERAGPSYTIDSIRQVRGRFGLHADAHLFLLLGSDNLRGFAQWKDIGELLELTEPLVVARELDLRPTLERLRSELSSALALRLEHALIASKPLEVSSTEIRSRLARGELCQDSLPAEVLEYIVTRGIYSARPPPTG